MTLPETLTTVERKEDLTAATKNLQSLVVEASTVAEVSHSFHLRHSRGGWESV